MLILYGLPCEVGLTWDWNCRRWPTKILIEVETPSETERIETDVRPDEYVLTVKQRLAEKGGEEIERFFVQHGGPFDPSIGLSVRGIEMNNMFRLEKFLVEDGAVVELKAAPESGAFRDEPGDRPGLRCASCGCLVDDENGLRYHDGSLAPQEWVYGLTVRWQWSCCGRVVAHPDRCWHPEGCRVGLCAKCRRPCACEHARAIRRDEEERF